MKKIYFLIISLSLSVCSFAQTIPPSNDLCSGAIPIFCGNVYSGTTVNATTSDDPGIGTCVASVTAAGVWYMFAGTGSFVTLDLCNNYTYDNKINVYAGTCGNFICIGGNDDAGPLCNISSFAARFSFNASLGIQYYILVKGYGGATGTFDLSVNCSPFSPQSFNDDCSSSYNIYVGSICNPVLGMGSPFAAQNAACVGSAEDDVWYYFTATTSIASVLVFGSANLDAVVELYSVNCGNTLIACLNNTGVGGSETTILTNLIVGTTY